MAFARTRIPKTLAGKFRRAQALGMDLPHAGTILVAGHAGVTAGGKDRGFQAQLVARSGWEFSLDAGLLVEAVTELLSDQHTDAIRSGRKADGRGSQPPLKGKDPRRAAYILAQKEGRRPAPEELVVALRQSPFRGYRTGRWAESISPTRLSGTTVSAKGGVGSLNTLAYNSFLRAERERGIEYFYVTGEAARQIEQAVATFLERGIDVRNRAGEVSLVRQPAA